MAVYIPKPPAYSRTGVPSRSLQQAVNAEAGARQFLSNAECELRAGIATKAMCNVVGTNEDEWRRLRRIRRELQLYRDESKGRSAILDDEISGRMRLEALASCPPSSTTVHPPIPGALPFALPLDTSPPPRSDPLRRCDLKTSNLVSLEDGLRARIEAEESIYRAKHEVLEQKEQMALLAPGPKRELDYCVCVSEERRERRRDEKAEGIERWLLALKVLQLHEEATREGIHEECNVVQRQALERNADMHCLVVAIEEDMAYQDILQEAVVGYDIQLWRMQKREEHQRSALEWDESRERLAMFSSDDTAADTTPDAVSDVAPHPTEPATAAQCINVVDHTPRVHHTPLVVDVRTTKTRLMLRGEALTLAAKEVVEVQNPLPCLDLVTLLSGMHGEQLSGLALLQGIRGDEAQIISEVGVSGEDEVEGPCVMHTDRPSNLPKGRLTSFPLAAKEIITTIVDERERMGRNVPKAVALDAKAIAVEAKNRVLLEWAQYDTGVDSQYLGALFDRRTLVKTLTQLAATECDRVEADLHTVCIVEERRAIEQAELLAQEAKVRFATAFPSDHLPHFVGYTQRLVNEVSRYVTGYIWEMRRIGAINSHLVVQDLFIAVSPWVTHLKGLAIDAAVSKAAGSTGGFLKHDEKAAVAVGRLRAQHGTDRKRQELAEAIAEVWEEGRRERDAIWGTMLKGVLDEFGDEAAQAASQLWKRVLDEEVDALRAVRLATWWDVLAGLDCELLE